MPQRATTPLGTFELRPQAAHRRPLASERVSYDDTGRQAVWSPPPSLPAGVAVGFDCERQGTHAPAELLRLGEFQSPREFLWAWTAAEAACKLLDIPVIVWLRENGLRRATAGTELTAVIAGRRVAVRTAELPPPFSLVVSCAAEVSTWEASAW